MWLINVCNVIRFTGFILLTVVGYDLYILPTVFSVVNLSWTLYYLFASMISEIDKFHSNDTRFTRFIMLT